VKFSDPTAETTEWQLKYENLTDAEAATLREFFETVEGTLNDFTFLDPAGNLLAWSDDFGQPVWHRDPLLSAVGGIDDPTGAIHATRLTNGGGGDQSISQTIEAPGGYQYCLSVYVRASQPSSVVLLLGGARSHRAVATHWSRITCSGAGDPAAESIAFGLELASGGCIDVFGMQTEPQAGASSYKSSTRGGVYANARLCDDALSMTATGENRHSCTMHIIHANHL
jgi:hypothetical protein